jgi:hypothetical protein
MDTPPIKPDDNNLPDMEYPLPFESIVVIIFGILISYLPLAIVFGFFMGPDATITPNMTIVKVLLLVSELLLLLAPIYFLKKRHMSISINFRLNPVPKKIILLIFPVSLSLIIITDEIDRLVQKILPLPKEYAQEVAKTMQINNGLDFFLIIFSVVIFAALIEEALFRGFLQQSIEKHIDVTKGVIYSSVVWALIHGSHYMLVQIFLFGFFLGWMAWRSNSIIPGIIAHGLNNTVAVIFYNFAYEKENPLPFYEWNGQVSLVWLIPAFASLYYGVLAIDNYYRKELISSSEETDSL